MSTRTYVGRDGRAREELTCPTCWGDGRLDWRGQRRVGLSSSRDDTPMTCPRCKGLGAVWTLLTTEAP